MTVTGAHASTPPTREERAAAGKATRREVPLASLGELVVTERDPVVLLESQAATRVEELVPIRYGRMLASPFAFYRGAALLMATDLSATPSPPLHVQLCGDAHLSNFGVFGSPERKLVFDLNDFDETHPGPFDWDVKRLAASVEIAARTNGVPTKQRREIVLSVARTYRETMTFFAGRSNLDVWYAHLDMDQVMKDLGPQLDQTQRKRTKAVLAKARTRDSVQAFAKLATREGGQARIVADPPLVVPMKDLLSDDDAHAFELSLRNLLHAYSHTLETDRRHLLEQYRFVDVARKVVGVGSVGTRAWILLMQGVDGTDPMFLQAKEAQASVLEGFGTTSGFANHGQRVVSGQRLMQAASDIFLGWVHATGIDGVERDFYVRQLRDWKGSADVETASASGLAAYSYICAWTLARAHARSGDRVALAAYLGGKPTFDQAIAEFSAAYADQNDRDHSALALAGQQGRVHVQSGL